MNAELPLVPLSGCLVAVVDLALTAVDVNCLATANVSRHVVLLCAERHAGAVCKNRLFRELLSFQQLREWGATRVECVDLLHLNRVVRQEVVQSVELVAAIVGVVLPENFEAKHATVIVKELFESSVGTTSLELNFDVVFELSLIGGHLLHVDHRPGVFEGVIWVRLGSSNVCSLVSVVAARELVAVDDSEDAAIHVDVHAQTEVIPVVVPRSVGQRQLCALQEHTLRNA